MVATLNDIQMEMHEKHFLIGLHEYGSRHRMLVPVIERALHVSPPTTHLVPSQNSHTPPGQDQFAFAVSYTIFQGLSMVVKSKSLPFLYLPWDLERVAEYF